LVPLFQIGAEKTAAPPWRNPTVLRGTRFFVPRPEIAERLREHFAGDGRLLRIEGPFGCGKTRVAWELLREQHGAPPLWATARPARHGGPTLVSQLLAQLLQGKRIQPADSGLDSDEVACLLDPHRQPPRLFDPTMAAELLAEVLHHCDGGSPLVVADGLEAAGAGELETLTRLADLTESSGRLRLVLIARPATAWPESWWVLPKVAVGPMDTPPMATFARGLVESLALPKEVEQRFTAAAAGNPFALEEGLAGLIPLKKLRQVYGSFFFNGAPDTGFTASSRLVQHTEAEARRLGGIGLLRRLALADTPLPPSALLDDDAAMTAVDEGLDPEGGADWRRAMIEHGWLRVAESPWGPGVELACPALGVALASVLSSEDRDRLRHELGERLWSAEDQPRKSAAWTVYRLLGEAPEGIEPLLAAAQDPGSEIPPQDLLERLTEALHGLRAGDEPDPDVELELLWYQLPLARRLGALQDYAAEVDRAMELSGDDPRRRLAFASLKAELEERKGHLVEATRTIRNVLHEARDDEDTPQRHAGEAMLALQLGRLLVRREQLDEARELLEELAEALDKRGARSLVASCSFYLGNVAIRQERFADAMELHRSALAERRKIGSPKSIGTSLSALGSLAIDMGHYVEALGAYREAEEIFTRLGDDGEASFALLGIGKALSRVGDYTGAARPVRRALAMREQAGDDPVGQAIARLEVAKNYFHLEQPAEALREARHCLFDLTLLTDATPRADAEQLLGLLLFHQHHTEQAAAHFREAHEGHRKAGATRGAALDLAYWLDTALSGNNLEQIADLVRLLGGAVERCANSERREILELRLYKGMERLAHHKLAQHNLALPHLERAYRGLMEKTQLLPPKDRHRFLFQIGDHEEIVEAATAKGLSIPASGQDGEPSTQPMKTIKG
jgi:tetratricopeptide (TPR) repeat protein